MRFPVPVHGAIASRLAVALCAVVTSALWCSASALAVAPEVSSESFSSVGSASATLSAQVNPGGLVTTYEFEYGTSAAYGSTTTVAGAGAGSEPAGALADLSGLAPETEYHFRAVAINEEGTIRGEDLTFRTFPSPLVGLPDGRIFEMVSPATNQDGNVYVPYAVLATGNSEAGVPTERPFDVAPSGNAVAYPGDPPTSGGNGSIGQSDGNEFVATRSPVGGWTATDVQPAGYGTPVYLAFSSDLSVGILESFQPLSTQAPSSYGLLYAHSIAGGGYQPFAGAIPNRTPNEFKVVYAAGSADFGQVLFAANDALGGTGAVDGGSGRYNLYDLSGGVLHLVNVLPDGETEAGASFGSTGLDRVISADGSRIVWSDMNTGALYVRENDTQPQSPIAEGRCTVPTDACTVLVATAGQFWTASADGSKVFFTNGELYEYDLQSGRTTDLSPGVEVAGVIGASEDGEYVYYVDTGDHLKLWHAGVTAEIAALSSADEEVEPYNLSGAAATGDWRAEIGQRTAEVAPDGRSVVFMSNLSLTGYDSGGLYEVFDYNAEQGLLTCVSCDPSGEAPPATTLFLLSTNLRLGAFLPVSWKATYQPRLLSKDGSRVFFDSLEPLVSNDTNGKVDVYEWEQEGAGSCQRSSGCVYLLSGGTSTDNSYLIGASESGDDVFIVTRAQLVARDQNGDDDMYDVRVRGVQPLSAPVCTGSGCQGVPAAAPFFATPASATFAGVGNFAAPSSTKAKAKLKPKRSRKRGKRRKRARAKRASGHSHMRGKAGRS